MRAFIRLLSVFIVVLLSACANHGGPPPACLTACVVPYGQVTGVTPGGVEAYSNCSADCVSFQPNSVSDVYTGMQWQCVEFARRWLMQEKGLVFASVDYAANIWADINALIRVSDDQEVLLEDYPNGSDAEPSRGDLLIYSKEFLGTGHVAVVLKVDPDGRYIEVGEQNFANKPWASSTARRIAMLHRGNAYWLEDRYLVGWKHIAE